MAIDKTKVAQNAQKLIQKGQLDKAIKEYQLLVEADPKDIRSLLKIAELYGKLNNKAEAIKTFRRVAEQYNKSGFYTKAVAVLRQAIEADPKQIDLYTQLADLYQKLGLNKDAILQLNTAARLFQDDGRHTQALEILQRMRDLDPEDPSVLARYGEALFNAGQRDQAIQIFRSLISSLKASNNNDDLIRFCERILTINPDDIEALKDLSRAYVRVGLANKALLKLKALFDRNVLDGELYDLLDRSYQILGKDDKAVHAQVEKAKFLLSQGKADDARRAYENVLQRDPANSDALSYLRPSRRNLGPAPAQPARAAPAAPAAKSSGPPSRPTPSGPPSGSKQLSKFLTEADVYLKYGLRDKALEQLENVLQHDPNNIAARRKLVDIYTEENPPKAAFHLRALADVSESLGEIEQAQGYRNRANELEPQEGEVGESEAPEANVPESGFLDEDSVGVDDESEISVESGSDDADVDVSLDAEPEAEAQGGESLLEGDEDLGAGDFLDSDETAEPASDVIDFEGGGPNLTEELDEAEFYIQQGIFKEALEIFQRILEKHPGHKVATERLAWVEAQMAAAKPAKKAAPPAKAAPVAEPPSEADAMFDLAAELEEELDFGEEAQATAESEEPPSFEDIFSQFKKGVERELKDDAGAHYDLGIAYKEMGLVSDAVGEFEIAMQSPARKVESCNMIAICYQELGQNEKAVEYFRRALESADCPPEAVLNMNYELACLFETMGDVRNAVLHFKKVVDNDKTYRDVGERIRALKARVQSGKAYA